MHRGKKLDHCSLGKVGTETLEWNFHVDTPIYLLGGYRFSGGRVKLLESHNHEMLAKILIDCIYMEIINREVTQNQHLTLLYTTKKLVDKVFL